MGLGQIIFEEITKCGPISFARFMELALYCPEYGFYEKEADTVGRGGDFYTSVSVGSLFGELLAFDFSRRLASLLAAAPGGKVQLLEAGAHDGRLARDILRWLRAHRPDQFQKIEYVLIEPSPRRQEWQAGTLAEFLDRIRWVESLQQAQTTQCAGVLFCNELLDAFPVRRVGWDAVARNWFEWGVGLQGDQLAWARLLPNEAAAGEIAAVLACPEELAAVLPHGFTTEFSPAASNWWREAARTLTRGWLVTLDYGLEREEFFHPQRRDGTLRSYHRHKLVNDVLAQPGEQDITAQVDFSALRAKGESAGGHTEFFGTQSKFLTMIATEAWKPGAEFGGWDAARTRQFQTLTHPEFLGRPFRALVQAKF